MGKKRRQDRSKRSRDGKTESYGHRSPKHSNPLKATAYELPPLKSVSAPEPDTVQRVEAGTLAGETQVPESVREVISSPGQSLDPSIQRAMEDRMGNSFGDVQIHTGPKAARACEDIDARAFTVGNHIAFNHGEYDPSSADGQHLIAHELAHVRQQTGGAVSMMPKSDADLEIDPDPELEREADEAAKQALSDGPVTINRMGMELHVQRSADRSPYGGDQSLFSPGSKAGETPENASADALEWDGLGKAAVVGLLGELPGGNVTGEMLDYMNSQATRIEQLQDDLEQIDPPEHWIRQTAKRVTELLSGDDVQTGSDTVAGQSRG